MAGTSDPSKAARKRTGHRAGAAPGFADRVRDLLDAGAGRVDFGTPRGLTDDRGVDLPGRAVLPRLR